METRKVQISGGSTFIVSLPKKWAEKNGISSGSSLNIMEDRNGHLILSPQPISFRESVIGEVRLNGEENCDALMRRLVGAYVSGVTSIVVTSKGAIPPDLARTVREFTRLVMGVEIVEEKKDLIKLQDLIDPADFSVRTGLKRMSYITEKMVEDSLNSLVDFNISILDDVIMRDMEVDRINWLIHKEYNMVTMSPKVADKTKISTEDALNYMISSRIVERVADHAVSIARYMKMAKNLEDRKLAEKIHKEGVAARKIFSDSVISLFSQDLSLADKVIDRAKELTAKLEPWMKKVFKLPSDEAVLLAYVVNSIDRIGAYGADIAKITLNTYIQKK
jgi:phosphate uptake regulator